MSYQQRNGPLSSPHLAAGRHAEDDASRVIEEAGAEEHYRPDGSLQWRRVLRRRTTDLSSGPSRCVLPRVPRTGGKRIGIIAASALAQALFWVHMGAVLIGDDRLGSGRGGAIGYLAGSAISTAAIWLLSRR